MCPIGKNRRSCPKSLLLVCPVSNRLHLIASVLNRLHLIASLLRWATNEYFHAPIRGILARDPRRNTAVRALFPISRGLAPCPRAMRPRPLTLAALARMGRPAQRNRSAHPTCGPCSTWRSPSKLQQRHIRISSRSTPSCPRRLWSRSPRWTPVRKATSTRCIPTTPATARILRKNAPNWRLV